MEYNEVFCFGGVYGSDGFPGQVYLLYRFLGFACIVLLLDLISNTLMGVIMGYMEILTFNSSTMRVINLQVCWVILGFCNG